MNVTPYVLEWHGPFSTRSDVKEWELKQSIKCHLYLFQAKHKGKQKYSYYCGKADQQRCYERLGNANHHIKVYEDERPDSILIWVATFSIRKRVTSNDISNCENMLISILHQLETDEDHNDNKTNYKAPNQQVYIINEWFDQDGNDYKIHNSDHLPNMIPDVIAFYPEAEDCNLYSCKKLKATAYLEKK